MGIVALLAFLSSLALYKSGDYQFVFGMLAGAWISVLGGFAWFLWREDEAKE